MALDDVVVRAMSKSPEDRYLSAGDLGRAAQAALGGTSLSLPERTVATGAAATREREAPAAATPESEPQTRELPGAPDSGPGRRGWLIGGGAMALIAAISLAVLLASGGGGGESNGAGGGRTAAQGVRETKPQKENPNPRPPALSAAILIDRGDRICGDSQETYKSYLTEFPSGEEEANVAYSRLLVGISSKAIRRFEALVPPAPLKKPFDAYVRSQEEVAQWDREALKAAERGDRPAYLAARVQRDATAEERKLLAEAVGFHVCSGSEA